jgi:hypothetical protein
MVEGWSTEQTDDRRETEGDGRQKTDGRQDPMDPMDPMDPTDQKPVSRLSKDCDRSLLSVRVTTDDTSLSAASQLTVQLQSTHCSSNNRRQNVPLLSALYRAVTGEHSTIVKVYKDSGKTKSHACPEPP